MFLPFKREEWVTDTNRIGGRERGNNWYAAIFQNHTTEKRGRERLNWRENREREGREPRRPIMIPETPLNRHNNPIDQGQLLLQFGSSASTVSHSAAEKCKREALGLNLAQIRCVRFELCPVDYRPSTDLHYFTPQYFLSFTCQPSDLQRCSFVRAVGSSSQGPEDTLHKSLFSTCEWVVEAISDIPGLFYGGGESVFFGWNIVSVIPFLIIFLGISRATTITSWRCSRKEHRR